MWAPGGTGRGRWPGRRVIGQRHEGRKTVPPGGGGYMCGQMGVTKE